MEYCEQYWNLEHWNLEHWNLEHWNLEYWNLEHWNLEHWNLEHWNSLNPWTFSRPRPSHAWAVGCVSRDCGVLSADPVPMFFDFGCTAKPQGGYKFHAANVPCKQVWYSP